MLLTGIDPINAGPPVDPTTALQAIQTWPVEDQLDLVFRLGDRLIDGGWRPELTDELRAELDRRVASREEVVARVKRPR